MIKCIDDDKKGVDGDKYVDYNIVVRSLTGGKELNCMFEDTKISPQEEIIVRRFVTSKFFDVDLFIDYLNSHETIGFDIFTNSNTGEKVGFTFLKAYKPLRQKEFIRRIPIYFYDINSKKNDESYMSELFRDYVLTKYEPKLDIKVFREDSIFGPDTDLEPLYELLQKIIHDFKIPLDRVFGYFSTHFGRNFKSKIVFHWAQYIEQLEKVDESNVFPESLYYAINVLLLSQNKTPRLVMPERTFASKPVFDSELKKQLFSVEGFFPVNENGELVMDWVGVWFEDIEEWNFKKSEYSEEDIDYIFFGNQTPKCLGKIIFTVKPESRIFVLRRRKNEANEFVNQWEQVFSGSKVTEFTFKPLVERREKKKLSQKEIAELADINLRSYQRIEKGESIPDALNLIALMSILGIDSKEEFIDKPIILDNSFTRFRSGNKPSAYIKNDGKGAGPIDEES